MIFIDVACVVTCHVTRIGFKTELERYSSDWFLNIILDRENVGCLQHLCEKESGEYINVLLLLNQNF